MYSLHAIRYKPAYVSTGYLYDVLGVIDDEKPDAVLTEWRENNMGTLADQTWQRLKWKLPEHENCNCWFLTNGSSEDQTQKPKLLCKTLAGLRLQLRNTQVADTTKLRAEYHQRLDNNCAAADVLMSHLDVWSHVAGNELHPEHLRRPTHGALSLAAAAAAKLEAYREAHATSHDGVGIFCEEMCGALARVKSLSWESIHRDKFSLTPDGIFEELCRNAEHLLHRHEREQKRREEWLQHEDNEEDEVLEDIQFRPDFEDKFGVRLGKFNGKLNKKCKNWKTAVQYASLVHLDEIRTAVA